MPESEREFIELIVALKSAHGAIDQLLAALITADRSFLPTKSDVWPTIVSITEVLRKHGAL